MPSAKNSQLAQPITPFQLFWVFSRTGLQGFGGVLPWAQIELVERTKWLSAEEFAELLSVGQVAPGPNIVNLAAMLGYRHCGWLGALSAFLGLTMGPLVILFALYFLYQRWSSAPQVLWGLRGFAAVTTAIIFVNGLKLLKATQMKFPQLVMGIVVFIGVGFLAVPLPWMLLGLAPISIYWQWRGVK